MTTESRRIKVGARIENLEDVFGLSRGAIEPSHVRSLAADDAMVDPEVLGLLMPSQLITRLGLRPTTLRPMRTPSGTVQMQMRDAVRLTIQERGRVMEVQEIQGDSPILVGRLPLLALDWVIDHTGQRVVGNPEHGGDWVVEAY
jgi:hypothetical protein